MSYLTDYLVTYRPSTNNDGYQQTVEGRTQTTLSELKPNTEYVIAVYSIYENRRSSSNTVMETTLALGKHFKNQCFLWLLFYFQDLLASKNA